MYKNEIRMMNERELQELVNDYQLIFEDPGMIDAEEIIELLEDHQGYIPESVEEDILNSIYNGNWTDAVEQMLESNITPNSLVDYIEDYRFEVCPGSYEWFTLEHAVSLTSLYGEVRSREAA
jgi:type I site-specific restriction-modification system R (restriction) subunit